MKDVVVLIPSIGGSALSKDNKEIWSFTPGAALRGILSAGKSIKKLQLEGDDPDEDDIGDGVRATRLVPPHRCAARDTPTRPAFHFAPHRVTAGSRRPVHQQSGPAAPSYRVARRGQIVVVGPSDRGTRLRRDHSVRKRGQALEGTRRRRRSVQVCCRVDPPRAVSRPSEAS
jgi:hypothetical protein